MNTMPISELIEQVTEICKKRGETAGFIWFFLQKEHPHQRVILILWCMDATIL